MRSAFAAATVLTLMAALGACEAGDAHVVGPKGRDAFARYVAIGSDLSMGVQSSGVLYNSQVQAWPALLAARADAPLDLPLLRAPGCPAPLIAPLSLASFLSGSGTAVADMSCAGALGSYAPPLGNLAIAGATAWAALNLTPKLVAATPTLFSAADRERYPLILANTQSQVTALLVRGASLVSVEFGMAEVLTAATSGLLVPATSYTQATPYTYVPAPLFAPVYSAIADSVKKSGARVVLLTVPHVTRAYGLRTGADLWSARTELAAAGIALAPDCNGSTNLIFTGAVVPRLARAALTSTAPVPFSCADVPLTADAVLTPADVSVLDGVVNQMNAQIRKLATQNGWALADLDALFSEFSSARPPYRSSEELGCVYPYGASVSLDGIRPNVEGHVAIANLVAQALNTTYGFTIPPPEVLHVLRPRLCS